MEQLQVKFLNHTIDLVSSDKEKLNSLVSKINERTQIVMHDRPNCNSVQLAFFVSLMLQKELDELTENYSKQNSNHTNSSNHTDGIYDNGNNGVIEPQYTGIAGIAGMDDDDEGAEESVNSKLAADIAGYKQEIADLKIIFNDLLAFLDKFIHSLQNT